MHRRSLFAVGAAALGFAAIAVGIYQELLHVASGYEGTIVTGWGRSLNHEEVLLARLGAVGVVGTITALRWRVVAVVPVAVGAVVVFYPVRAVVSHARRTGLYTEVPTVGGGTTRFVLGAEPFLLAAGGMLLVVAGVLVWRSHATRTGNVDAPERSSAGVQ